MAVTEGSVRTETGRSLAYAQMGQQDGTPLLYSTVIRGRGWTSTSRLLSKRSTNLVCG